jgi:hypothetical protein
VAAAALVGCEASARVGGGGDKSTPTQATQLAAFAANPDNQYPAEAQASDDLRAAAVVNRESQTFRVYNFGDEPIERAKVWVNGEYVYEVNSIPAKGSREFSATQFYRKDGRSLQSANVPIQRVQVQTGDDALANLQGPVFE